jgi:HNH endonuclease
MKEIPLRNNKKIIVAYALVDDDDYEWLMQWKWHFSSSYARRNIPLPDGKQTQIQMHRVIIGAVKGDEVDHINRNRLDNRKCNLRKATRSQNNQNRTKLSNTLSKFKGVTWHKKHSKWYAQIVLNTKHIFLGLYENEVEAAQAYDNAAKEYFGDYANPNF